MRANVIRTEVRRLVRQAPFQAFVLNMENGDRITIDHPENIAFDPGERSSGGSLDFYVISGEIRCFGAFDAVTSVATVDSVQHLEA